MKRVDPRWKDIRHSDVWPLFLDAMEDLCNQAVDRALKAIEPAEVIRLQAEARGHWALFERLQSEALTQTKDETL